MKKLVVTILSIGIFMLGMMSFALAAEVKPGDTITVTVEITENPNNMTAIKVNLNYPDILVPKEGAIAKFNGWENVNGTFVMNAIKVGETVQVEFTVKTDAPDGSYKIEKGSIEGVGSGAQATLSNNTFTVKSAPSSTPHTHTWGAWKVTKEANCTETGLKERTCSGCGEVEKETLAKDETAHDWGDWEVTKPAAPGVAGEETRTCKNDPSHTETRPIDPLPVDDPTTPPVIDPTCPHTNKSWKKIKTAGCTTEGESQYSCDECGEVFEIKVIPAAGHDDGEWVLVKEATKTEDGLKQLQCTRCHEVLKEEIIKPITAEWRYNQSVSSLGIRFRDIKPELTKKWYMFTPIDLSKDGTQTFDLIAANITKVGKLTVKVADGKVTVTYKIPYTVIKRDMAFTILPDLASVTDVEIKNLNTYAFGQEISIADDLGGDTNVLLLVQGHVDYDFQDTRNDLFIGSSNQYKNLIEQMKGIMD